MVLLLEKTVWHRHLSLVFNATAFYVVLHRVCWSSQWPKDPMKSIFSVCKLCAFVCMKSLYPSVCLLLKVAPDSVVLPCYMWLTGLCGSFMSTCHRPTAQLVPLRHHRSFLGLGWLSWDALAHDLFSRLKTSSKLKRIYKSKFCRWPNVPYEGFKLITDLSNALLSCHLIVGSSKDISMRANARLWPDRMAWSWVQPARLVPTWNVNTILWLQLSPRFFGHVC